MKRHVVAPATRRERWALTTRAFSTWERCARQRASDFWIPPVNVQKQDASSDATQLLIRAGYLRQAYAGIFHMLPLGLRVQEKVEKLIDKHMRSVHASKVSLSSLSSRSLWQKSGRWTPGAEFFSFKDRKDAAWLLTPTHEEEITTILADVVHSRHQLPVRLYQIGRKYRDEKRPRGGLLRGREFLMKDLYTFDATPEEAHATYEAVRSAYRSFLDELTVAYTEARAESGNMGGNLSHEYHFPNSAGEDIVITCSECDYARNEEFVTQRSFAPRRIDALAEVASSTGDRSGQLVHQAFLAKDGRSLVRACAFADPNSPPGAASCAINPFAVKAALEDTLEVDSGVEDPVTRFEGLASKPGADNEPSQHSIYYLLDSQVELHDIQDLIVADMREFSTKRVNFFLVGALKSETDSIDLLKQQAGDACPQCFTGRLKLAKAIEVGHTFHLGTRYSAKLALSYRSEDGKAAVPVEMGCHGIGVSRLIAAVASCLSDGIGLNWPRVMAPFEVAIVYSQSEEHRLQAAEGLYDQLSSSQHGPVDVLLDDRPHGLGWKLKDADMIGYPVIVVLGKGFDQGKVEVQCRRLKVKELVDNAGVVDLVHGLLKQL